VAVSRTIAASLLFAAVIAAPASVAAEAESPRLDVGEAGADGGASQAEAIRELQEAIRVRDRVIRGLIKRTERLEEAMQGAEPGPSESESLEASSPAIPAAAPASEKGREASTSAPPEQPDDVPAESLQSDSERLIRRAFETALVDRGGLLLPPFTFEYAPTFSYVHSQSDNIVVDGFGVLPVLVVGDIQSERIRRDAFNLDNTFRIGLPFGSQAEIRIPTTYQSRRAATADGELIRGRAKGVGDVEIAISKELYRSTGAAPSLLGSLRWKTQTGSDPFSGGDESDVALGSGYDSLQGTLTGIKVLDPVVFFSSLSYTRNFETKIDAGDLKAGDRAGLSLGIGLALNLQTSLNFGLQVGYQDVWQIGKEELAGSDITTSTFSMGVAYNPGGRSSFDLQVSVGLTEDSPDVAVAMTVPIRFSWKEMAAVGSAFRSLGSGEGER